jgi:2-keto-4-pentenoate hydratase/2-oxohepta-3-ene-1,7-dioic acid hydratase in catechol pathway
MNSLRLDSASFTPSKIVCVGRNYLEHIRELGNETPDQMVIFNKPNSAISTTLHATHGEPLHYEGEICFMVRNRKLHAVGFGLDLTRRELQSNLKARAAWRYRDCEPVSATRDQWRTTPGWRLRINDAQA